jgi:hypothetical protein
MDLSKARVCQLLVEGKVVNGDLVWRAVGAGVHNLDGDSCVSAGWAPALHRVALGASVRLHGTWVHGKKLPWPANTHSLAASCRKELLSW